MTVTRLPPPQPFANMRRVIPIEINLVCPLCNTIMHFARVVPGLAIAPGQQAPNMGLFKCPTVVAGKPCGYEHATLEQFPRIQFFAKDAPELAGMPPE